ncbi:MAG TPA: TolC family protein [Pyrinomonadaceae bacterium]|jgi:HAE1 family hydrophobic/amphiphilic exporter-1
MKFLCNFTLILTISVYVVCFNAQTAFGQAPDEKQQIAKNNVEKIEIKTEDKTSTVKENKTVNSIGISSPSTSSTILHRVGVQTDQPVPLSLDEAIRTALENNNQIEVARDDVRFQETQLRSLLGIYDPVFSVSPTFSRNSSTGSGGSNDFRVDTNFNRQIKAGGGNYNVFLNSSQTGQNSRNNTNFNQTSGLASSSSTTYFSSTGISYTQPLFRNFRIDNTRRQIKIQRKRLQQTDADFRRQTIEVISQVQRAYWDLVFALRDQQNRVANLNLARENLRQVEARIEAGASAPLARAEVATELANRETDVLLATQQVSVTENTLKSLLLKNPESPLWSQSYVPTDKPVFSLDVINMEDALKDARDNRPELRRLQLQRDINAIDISYFRNQLKPQIDLNSTFSLGGLSLSGQNTGTTTFPVIAVNAPSNADTFLLNEINRLRSSLTNFGIPIAAQPGIPEQTVSGLPNYLSGGTFRSFRNLFRTDAPNFSVGVTFSFPVGNRTAKANLAGARIQDEQIQAQARGQEQTIIAEVRNAVQAVETARQRVLTARRARENAEIQLEGERKLFDVGRSTTFLLFQRENALTNARNSEIRAETDYNKALADLQRATSTTFRVNNIEVDSPVDDK